MSVGLAVLIGGGAVAVAAVVFWVRATRAKPEPLDPISSTTGSNRTLTGGRAGDSSASFNWSESLRRFVAYALDDVPREALSRAPDPDHAPVFQSVALILE